MKKVILFLIVVNFVLTQNFGWQDGGVPVRQGAHIEWSRTGDVGDNGNMILGWSDTRTGNRDVYAQKVDSNGNELWGEEGLLVVGYEGRQEDPVFISDGDGGVYVIWSDFRNPPISDGQPYAQHIASDGSLTWDADGVALSDDKLTEYTLNMCKDGNGGVFAIWKKKSSSHYGSYINITNTGPTDEVEVISNEWAHSSPSLETAGSGGAVMVWADERNADKDIYAQRLGYDGTNILIEWESIEDVDGDGIDDYPKGGIPVVTASGDQSSQKVTYYSEDYSVIVWQDERYSSSPDIFATFLDIEGFPVSFYGENGLPIVSSHDTQGGQQYADNFQHKKPRVKADSNGAFVIWNDFYRPDGSGDIYIQKITHENNNLWDISSELPFDGIVVSDESGEQSNSRLTLDGNGGAYVVWENYNLDEEKDIKIKHLDSNGVSTYDDYGLLISNADKDQISPLVRKDGNGGAFSVWQDQREGSIGLYVQHIDVSGTISMLEDGIKLFYGIDYNGQLYNDEDPLQTTPKSLYLGDDQTLLFWEDDRNGNQNVEGISISTSYVFAELINEGFGNTGTSNGTVLSDSPVQSKPSVKSYDSGYIYHFIGQDISSGENVLNLEYLDDSFMSIQDNPISVDGSGWANQKNFVSEYDIEGNLFVIYAREEWGPSSIWLQVYNQYGVELLSSPINVVSNTDGQNYYPREMFQNPAGGMVLVYDQNESDIRVIGINNDGTAWNEAISIVANTDGQQFQDAVSTNEGIFITWKDSRSGNNDIFGQHIAYGGIILGGNQNGISLSEEANDQSGASVAYIASSNNVTICWEDFRNGSHWDAYCREVNLDYHVVGAEFILSDAIGDQMNPFLYTSLTNTVLVVWEDFRNDTNEYSDIYFQEIVNGQGQFTNNGAVVCDGFHNQVNPKIDILSDQSQISYLIYWDDMRSSGKEDLINVFSQQILIDDCSGVVGGISGLDCAGVCGGSATPDYCDLCASGIYDCAGECDGNSLIDDCSVCVAEGDTTCVQGCDGNYANDGSHVVYDLCLSEVNPQGVCGGDNSTCLDCAGEVNGEAVTDGCGECAGGNTGKEACALDCNGLNGGTAFFDNCGVCVAEGDTTCVQGCDGNYANDGSHVVYDLCVSESNPQGVCGGGNSSCLDCADVPNGTSIPDDCGACVAEGDTTCVQGCDGNYANDGSHVIYDLCVSESNPQGVCGGGNSSCLDCADVPNGTSIPDDCGVCNGNSCYQQDCESYPYSQYNCEGAMLSLDKLIPSEFGLMQNYPNPFNPTTAINFSIPEFSMVSISIYNVNGQKVKSLIKSIMGPGYHQVKWNGSDDSGVSVSNGIYFYIMESSNFVEKRKMIFIK